MKQLYIIVLLLLASVCMSAQTQLRWKTLAKIDFENKFDEELGYQIAYPAFSSQLKDLDGKIVTIKGYIIPLDDEAGYFAFSAYPYQSCFFCGAAGVETVMEVYAKKEVPYSAEAVTLKGRLELNDKDMVEHLIYILRDAEIVE